MSKNSPTPAEEQLPVRSSRVTALVSVALVLLLVGITAIMAAGAMETVSRIRSTMGFVVVVKPGAEANSIDALRMQIEEAPYTATVTYDDPETVMERWQQMIGEEEDIMTLLDGENPFTAEFDVKVQPDYASPDSLRLIARTLEADSAVESVRVSADIIEQVSRNVGKIMLLCSGVVLLLLVISIILVNNTVRLTIFSRRRIIHTMQLVGATGSFIRRPLVGLHLLDGFLAGVAASLILFGALCYARSVGALPAGIPGAGSITWVMIMLPVAGAVLCGITSLLAVNKYLRRTQEEQ